MLREDNNNLTINEINILDEDIKSLCKVKLQQKYFNKNCDPKNILP